MTAHGNDLAANAAKGEAFCRQAAAQGADIALFPEMWSAGYTPGHPSSWQTTWRAAANWQANPPPEAARPAMGSPWHGLPIDRDGHFIQRFQSPARDLKIAIAITYLERWPGAPRNSLSLIDRHGELHLTYAKVHTCDFNDDEFALTPGTDFPVATIETAAGPLAIGAMNCYDRELPEIGRILAVQGTEIVLTPNACGLALNRISQFRTRAFENMIGMAMANYAAPQQNGHSVAFDGVACTPTGEMRAGLLIEAGEGEGIFIASFDLDTLRAYRARGIWGGAFRRPHRYGLLAEEAVATAFRRVNAAGIAYDPLQR